jgi:hypothetical protein
MRYSKYKIPHWGIQKEKWRMRIMKQAVSKKVSNRKSISVFTALAMVIAVLAMVTALAGCSGTDVIGKVSVTSFDSVLTAVGDKVTTDEMNNGWSLQSPGGERLVLSKDFSSTGKPDLMMELNAKPFLDAGLDPTKLPEGTYWYDAATSLLMVHSEQGTDKFTYAGDPTPLDTFKQIVATHRSIIGYHEKLDHYGVAFGNGNMFEWAKDMATNDKDIVFVLNPQPFIDAGVDPAAIKEWVFAKVEVKDANGKKELVDKFLKPYNLK